MDFIGFGMAIEKRWEAIPARLFTSNGGAEGQVTLASTRDFKVKQEILLKGTGLDGIKLEVKRVVSDTLLLVGKPGDIKLRENVTAYTTAASATIEALEQSRHSIPDKEYERAVYAEEPIVAKRTISVDEGGDYYNESNPLPVYNPNEESQQGKNVYDEVSAVPTSAQVDVVSYTVPVNTRAWLVRVEASGGNVATYDVLVNNTMQAKRRTYFGSDMTTQFEFSAGLKGLPLEEGDIVLLKAVHQRPDVCDFEGRILVIEAPLT